MFFINPIKYVVITFLKIIRSFYRGYGYFLQTSTTLPFGCVYSNPSNIKLGRGFSMGSFCRIYAQDDLSSIVIGDRVAFNDNTMINADNGGRITIGDGSMFGPNTVLRASNHVFSSTNEFFRDQGHNSGIIKIGKNVWLGSNVIVLPNVTIGNNVVVGAGSVVTKNIPSNSIAFGVPAAVHKKI
jgi:acetyltransferase-like isoleucine patch superfamily enzyme